MQWPGHHNPVARAPRSGARKASKAGGKQWEENCGQERTKWREGEMDGKTEKQMNGRREGRTDRQTVRDRGQTEEHQREAMAER